MRYYLIAGEASGDLHASNLMRELKKIDPAASFRFWGGDLMLAQGGELVKHYRDLAFMGFTEVVMNIRTIMRNLRICKHDIIEYQPDVVILVDYPGFNLRIAEFVSKQGIKVFYYVSPQIWAWKQARVKRIKAYVDHMFVILPFEKEFYKKFDYEVDYVGHPLLDAIENRQLGDSNLRLNEPLSLPVVALLPGSRKQEIKRMLPVMLKLTERFPQYRYIITGAPSQNEAYYRSFMHGYATSELVFGKTYDVLQIASAALVTSGTATLETALFRVPQAVCYKAGFISYHIAKRLVKVPYISLVNLIMGKEIVKEFIQQEMNADRLAGELDLLMNNEDNRKKMLADYDELRKLLGGSGASGQLAYLMFNYLTVK
jgi:lipid-A-disaccharide synthase